MIINNSKNLFLLLMLPIWILLYMNLELISNSIVYDLFSMQKGAHLSEAIDFFLFETPKVMLLLLLIVFFVGVIRTYFSAEKTRKSLEGKSLLTGNVLASLLGIVTPFCSCSAIPLFLGFIEAGIPVGVTFSFLIAAPVMNEIALIMLVGLVGWQVALIYVITGLFIAIISGWLIEKLGFSKYLADWVIDLKKQSREVYEEELTYSERIDRGFEAVKEIIGKIWVYILIGIAIGAAAHGYIPQNYLSDLLGESNWYSVPLAILIGIPLYSNAAGIIPIISVLIEKGVTLGTALAFMMSVIGLSLPEIIILKKVLKPQLIIAFVTIVAIAIVAVGFLFNFLF